MTEGASLVTTISGVPAATVTEGVVTDVSTSPSAINFGSFAPDTDVNAAHRVTVETNGTEGYQVFMFVRQDLLNGYGDTIAPIAGTNESPVAWLTGCDGSNPGCFGYHVGDDTLAGGSTRFAAPNTFAGASTTPEEIMFSSVPTTADTEDLVFRINVSPAQVAGVYNSELVYITVPVY